VPQQKPMPSACQEYRDNDRGRPWWTTALSTRTNFVLKLLNIIYIRNITVTFSTSHMVIQHCHYSYWIAWPRKHRYSRWNFIPVRFTNWDICIWSLENAVLDFPLRVSSNFVIQYCHYRYWIAAGPWKYRYSRWNFEAILFTSWDIRICSLMAAILNFPLPVAYLLLTIISLTPEEFP